MKSQTSIKQINEFRFREFHPAAILATIVVLFSPLTLPSLALAQRAVQRVDLYGDPLPANALKRLGTLRYRHHDRLTAFALSHDGKIAATGGNGRISVIETDTGKQRVICRGSESHDSLEKRRREFVSKLVFSPDGTILAAIQGERLATIPGRRCRVWSVPLWEELSILHQKSNKALRTIAFTIDGTLLGTVDSGNEIKIVNLRNGEELTSLQDRDQDSYFGLDRISQDGGSLLLYSKPEQSRDATLWNTKTGKQIVRRKIPTDQTPLLTFTHTGAPLSVYSHGRPLWSHGNHHIRIVDVLTGKTLQEISEKPDDNQIDELFFEANCIGISRYSDLIATSAFKYYEDSDFAKVRIRNLTTKKERLSIAIPRKLAGEAQFSADSSVVAIWNGGGTMRYDRSEFQSVGLWEMPGGRRLDRPIGHQAPVGSVSFSPDGKTLASASFDGTVRLWNLSDGKQIHQLSDAIPNGNCVTFSPDGQYIAATCKSEIIVWDAETGKALYSLPVARLETGSSLAFSRDGNRMATGALEYLGGFSIIDNPERPCRHFGTLEVWDRNDFNRFPYKRKRPEYFPLQKVFRQRGALSKFSYTAASVAFSRDGTILATGGWETDRINFKNGLICLWKLPEGNLIRKISSTKAVVGQIAFSPDGKLLASVGSPSFHLNDCGIWEKDPSLLDEEIHLWNPEDGSQVGKLKGNTSELTSIAFSPDGKCLASGGVDKTVRIWDLNTRIIASTLTGHESDVLCVCFSPDGKILASGSKDTTILLWDFASILSSLP